jgi:MtN3 and saliva related transmembrane protein
MVWFFRKGWCVGKEEIIGFAAALLTTVSFLPQVARASKTRSTRDLSFGMVLLLFAGIGLWLVYGLLTHQMPLIASNIVTLGLVVTLIVCKLRYK